MIKRCCSSSQVAYGFCKVQQGSPQRLDGVPDPAGQVVFDVEVQRALQQLRHDQRAAIVLCVIAGYKIVEASALWQVDERRC